MMAPTSIERLGDRISILSGYPFPSSQFDAEFGTPLIRIRDLDASKTETKFRGSFDPAYFVHSGDILVGMDGDFIVARWKGADGLLNQRVCKVESASPEVNQRFLFWWLRPHVTSIHRRTPQTTVRHLSVSDLRGIPHPQLSSAEQQSAAVVLDTLDEVIEKTESVIAKSRQVRAGLLHDLLTRGLDENGELRDLIRHPEQFKNTEIGRLPLEWHLKKIDEIKANSPRSLAMGPFGSNIAVDNFIPEGIPVIRGVNLNGPIIDFSEVVFVSEKKANELIASNIVWNDIVITHRGTVGQVSLFKENSEYERAVISQSQLKITCDRKAVSPPFLSLYFNSTFGQKLINMAKAHTGVQAIGQPLSSIREMKIPLPWLDEQQRIEAVLTDTDMRITMEEAFRKKLIQIKVGLMSDLLTGRVRVPEGII